MKKIIYIIILTILISCSTSEKRELKSNKTISEIFNKSEINDLQIILDFFNGQICDSNKLNNDYLNKCYEKYCSEIKSEMILNGGFNPKIDYEKQLELYEKIDKANFNKIWKIGKSYNLRTKENFKHLELNYKGKYLDFLKKYGEENKTIHSYYESIINAGDISPSTSAILILNYKLIKPADIRSKLIIAIHYLTLNDNFNRKEKY